MNEIKFSFKIFVQTSLFEVRILAQLLIILIMVFNLAFELRITHFQSIITKFSMMTMGGRAEMMMMMVVDVDDTGGFNNHPKNGREKI